MATKTLTRPTVRPNLKVHHLSERRASPPRNTWRRSASLWLPCHSDNNPSKTHSRSFEGVSTATANWLCSIRGYGDSDRVSMCAPGSSNRYALSFASTFSTQLACMVAYNKNNMDLLSWAGRWGLAAPGLLLHTDTDMQPAGLRPLLYITTVFWALHKALHMPFSQFVT